MVIKNHKLPKIPRIQGPAMKIRTNHRKVKLKKMMTIVLKVKKVKAIVQMMSQNQMKTKRT